MTQPEFAQIFAVLATQLRASDVDEATIRSYFKALGELEIEFVAMAAEELGRTAEWFPKTSEWRDAARKVEQRRQEQQAHVIRGRMRAGLPPLCLDCDDTQWARTPTTGGPEAVKRCHCQQLRRLEVLGRRPLPELPASREADAVSQVDGAITALAATKAMPAAGVYLQTDPAGLGGGGRE